jgi:hypothetical protein
MCQVLQAATNKPGRFVALIVDPETNRTIKEVTLYAPQLAEAVELRIEWDTDLEKETA